MSAVPALRLAPETELEPPVGGVLDVGVVLLPATFLVMRGDLKEVRGSKGVVGICAGGGGKWSRLVVSVDVDAGVVVVPARDAGGHIFDVLFISPSINVVGGPAL